jgi:glycosyltransferase involved in cell wall biosynthesis
MKISYLVTCSTETDTLKTLLKTIRLSKTDDDDIVILMDEKYVKEQNETHTILGAFHHCWGCRILSHPLNNDYGAHKNYGIEICSGDYIFQLDGDELPPESLLGENLHELINSNPTIEAYAVPRINDFRGVTDIHAKRWGWRLTPSTTIIHEKIIDTNSSEYKFLKENGYILEEMEIH